MARPAVLEAFEVIDGGAPSEPSGDWVAGHAAGFAEAMASAEADEAVHSAALVQTLSDMSFGYHEARGHLVAALVPLFSQLIETFVPRFGHELLVPQIAETLADIAARSVDAPITVSVAPSQTGSVTAALAQITDLPFTLRPDPALSAGQVLFHGSGGERILDVDAMIAQTQAILASLLDVTQQRSDHG